MSSKRYASLAVAALLLLPACGSRGDHAPRSPNPLTPEGPDATRARADDVNTVLAQVEAALAAEPDCVAGGGGTVTGCPMADVTYTPAEPAHGQTVMIIDSGMYFSAYTRYAQRVVGIYERQPGGHVVPAPATFRMSHGAYRIVHDILGAAPVHVLQAETDRYAKEYSRKFSAGIPDALARSGHGTPILNMIADLAPAAQLVAVNGFSSVVPTNELLCNLATSAGWTAGKAAVDHTTRDLRDLIASLGVTMINLSSGHDFAMARRALASACPSVDKETVLAREAELWRKFVTALGSTPGVTLVEAGPYPTKTLTASDPEAPVDCLAVPNRIRIGFFTRKDSGVDSEGLDAATGAPAAEALLQGNDTQVRAKACVDLFVNAGFEMSSDGEVDPGPHALTVSRWGLETRRWAFESGMSTSYATPLAVAYLAHLQSAARNATGAILSPEALRAQATGDGLRRLRDPLRNGTLDVQ